MLDPRKVAFDTVEEMLKEGAKKHDPLAWRKEPTAMHLMKSARHAQTAVLLLDHPEYTKDAESAIIHAKQDLCRAAMALTQLLES
jgi:hypothetical protein